MPDAKKMFPNGEYLVVDLRIGVGMRLIGA